MRSLIYLDHNASAPMLPGVAERCARWLGGANASSVHALGREARAEIERCRDVVADAVGGDRVVFTSGATEAANTVLAPDWFDGRTPRRFERLLVGATEHPCVLEGGRFEADAIEQVPVDRNGVILADALRDRLAASSSRALVAIALANNETGVVQDIATLSRIAHDHGAVFVCDAVQAFGRMDVNMHALGADVLLLSSHKIGGAQGAGAMVVRHGSPVPVPLLNGGGQESGLRSGTENVFAISSFAAAVEFLRRRDNVERQRALRDRFETALEDVAPSVTVHGAGVERLPNTSSFSFAAITAETAQIAFDLDGIAVSAVSACSSGKVGKSHVLDAMGVAGEGAIRLSLGPSSTEDDMARALETVRRLGARDLEKSAARETREAA